MTEEYEYPDSSFLAKDKGQKGNKSYAPQWQQAYYGKGNKGKARINSHLQARPKAKTRKERPT